MEPTAKRVSIVALGNFAHAGGRSYTVRLPAGAPPGDSPDSPLRSAVQVFENGAPLGPPHSQHAHVAEHGAGRFSHWGDTLYFSASDNSDPRDNGRLYEALLCATVGGRASRAASHLQQLTTDFSPEDAYVAIERALQEVYPGAWLGEHAKSFWRETRLTDACRRLCGDNRRSFERKFAIVNLLKLAWRIEGDVAECGVFEGATAWFLADSLRAAKVERTLHLFDSFDGLSAPGAVDGDYWRRGSLTANETVARDNLKEFSTVRFHPGWIPTRFQEVADRRFSFVHIDVDLFEPTHRSLEFFYPRLAEGALLVCDDYGFDTCPGARKAMDDFFREKPEPIVHLPSGQAFVIKA